MKKLIMLCIVLMLFLTLSAASTLAYYRTHYTYASWANSASPARYSANYHYYYPATSRYSYGANYYGYYPSRSIYSYPGYHGHSRYYNHYSIYDRPQYYGH